MSLIGKIKTAFGLSESEYEEQVNNEATEHDATVTPLNTRTREHESPMPVEPVSFADAQFPDDQAVPQEIFAHVVKVFNESLPPFLKEAVDEEAQRKYLYDALDEGMKSYIANLSVIADNRVKAQYADERSRLNRDLEDIREKSRRMEGTSAEWREQKLSAERQKRALSERVHDLEKQIDTLQAEKEQYDLENKSLVNKIRVMSTIEGDFEALKGENETLKAEIEKMKSGASPADVASSDLQDQLEESRKQFEELTELSNAAIAENKQLAEKNQSLGEDIETLKKRCEIADAMINDLNHRFTASQKTIAERDEQLAERDNIIAQRDEQLAQLSELTSAAESDESAVRIAELEEQLQAAREEVALSQESLSQFEKALDKFEEIKQNKDSRISQLLSEAKESQSTIDSQGEQIESLNEEIESLKSTIANNLELQASSEAMLRQEIEHLRRGETERRRGRKPSKPVSLDDNLDDTNWLVATPPEGTNVRPFGVSDDEFGYQEPKRKPVHDDPAQMSLFG